MRKGDNGKPYRFYVPAYQRGYRWGKQQVEDLLRDLIEFKDAKENGAVEGQYCLQPLIVKKRNDGSYTVVDGQQRLTTIAIFRQVSKSESGFSIEYETREKSKNFLASLGKDDEQAKNEKDDNIDYHYMWQAYDVMNKFFDKQVEPREELMTELNDKIENSAFFIWYEIEKNTDKIDDNTYEIELFQRVNMGKISLTNAELIKGVFFRDQNYTNTTMESEQLALANSWQEIEHGLENDAFWYFFNGVNKSYETRLDVLFQIIARQEDKNKRESDQKDPIYAFHVFDELFREEKDRTQLRETLWKKVKLLNAQLHYWYDNLDYYHIIGYLLATGTGVQKILDLIDGKKKSQQIDDLMALVKNRKFVDTFLQNPEAIEYGSSGDKKAIANLLLLFNIATLVAQGDKQHRFPFDIYKKEDWDIEHIHATADKDGEGDADNRIHNLTLLDATTNRAYGNKPFLEKRAFLLKKEQAGQFIPTATRNIFIKAYTDDLQEGELKLWTDADKKQYIEKMQVILQSFFDKEWRKKERNSER
nr:DUF262 domain-containing protein [Entomospira culicis]